MVHVGELHTETLINPVFMSVKTGVPCKWTTDSKRFILDNFDIIQDCPARIYNVAPVLCPPSWLHECYSSEFSHRIEVVVGPAQWGTCIYTVFNIAYSHALACWNNNVAAVGPTLQDITILDALTGSQTAVISGHTACIISLTYSSDGTFLVSGSDDKTIKLWDVQTGGVIKTLCGHTDRVHSVSISADNTMIASASRDRTICLWNIKTGNHHIIERYRDYANNTTFSPVNSQLLSLSGSGTVQQWNINGCKIGSSVPGDYIVFSQDGTQFVSWKEKTVTIRNTGSRATTKKFNLASKAHYCCFSPNGRFIAAATFHVIYLWDITSSDPCLIQTFIGHSGSVTSLVFSSPYSLISASIDKSIKFWQISALPVDPGTPSTESTSLTSAQVKSVSLQARDGLAFSIDLVGVLKTWDILTGCCKESCETQIERVEHADIQLIGDRLIIVWKEMLQREINVWEAKKGKLQTISIPHVHIQGLRIIGDGSRVLLLDKSTIEVWDIWTGRSLYWEWLKRDDGNFNTLRWSSIEEPVYFDTFRMDDSKVLIHLGSSVQGWDFGTPGTTPIQFSKTSSGGPHLNLIDKDGPVKIEDGITGKEIFQLHGKYAEPSAMQWDGQYLIAGYELGEVLILNFGDVLS